MLFAKGSYRANQSVFMTAVHKHGAWREHVLLYLLCRRKRKGWEERRQSVIIRSMHTDKFSWSLSGSDILSNATMRAIAFASLEASAPHIRRIASTLFLVLQLKALWLFWPPVECFLCLRIITRCLGQGLWPEKLPNKHALNQSPHKEHIQTPHSDDFT